MKLLKIILFIAVCFSMAFPAPAQTNNSGEAETEEEPQSAVNFLLLPILETAFSGNLIWRPDWPDDITPDFFSLLKESGQPSSIELSREEEKYIVKLDKGRLVEFPAFLADGIANVKAGFTASGALQNMSLSFSSEQNGDEQAEENVWNIEFPPHFFPYSDLSLGGAFPVVKITAGESVYHVYFFESSAFLTETWYDSGGNMIVFCRANVSVQNGKWSIRSLQIHDNADVRFEDYFFDSGGNITEVRRNEQIFQALYMDKMPTYWKNPSVKYDLQWDMTGTLTGKTSDAVDYRYEYEKDSRGNWIKRRENAFAFRGDLLAPDYSLNRGTWSRRIEYSTAVSEGD